MTPIERVKEIVSAWRWEVAEIGALADRVRHKNRHERRAAKALKRRADWREFKAQQLGRPKMTLGEMIAELRSIVGAKP